MNLFAMQKQNCRCKEQTYGCQEGKQGGRMNWEIGIDIYNILINIKQVTYENLLHSKGSPSGSLVKNPCTKAGDTSSIPGLGRSPGEGNDNPLQCSCLGNPWPEEPGGVQESMGWQQNWIQLNNNNITTRRAKIKNTNSTKYGQRC